MSILASAIIICLLMIIALHLSIKSDHANREIEFYKKRE